SGIKGHRCGICSKVSIASSSRVTNWVAFSIESAAIRIHISSISFSAVLLISTRCFVATLELAHERADGTRPAGSNVSLSRRQQSGHVAGAEVFIEALRIHQDRIRFAIDGQDHGTAGLTDLIEDLSRLPFKFGY